MDLPALREKLRDCQRKAAATDEVAAKKAYLLMAETWQSMIRVEETDGPGQCGPVYFPASADFLGRLRSS
jgi:hypothetical protein